MHLHWRNHSLRCPPDLAEVDIITHAKPRPLKQFCLPSGCEHYGCKRHRFFKCAGVTLVAYSVSRIVTEQTDEHSDRLLFYGEPTPESIGALVRTFQAAHCRNAAPALS